MTDRPAGPRPMTGSAVTGEDLSVAVAVRAAERRSRLVLFAERFWRAAIWPVGWAVLFVSLAWLGLFEAVPDRVRFALVAALGVGFIGSFFAFRHLRWPRADEAIDRIEAETGLSGHPLHTLTDRHSGDGDSVSAALWAAHLERLRAKLPVLRAGVPHPDLGRRDRYLLRPVLAMLLFVGLMVSQGRHGERLETALNGPKPQPPEAARLDAWVTPPAYTGKLAIMLTGDRAVAPEADGKVLVPQGSVLSLRTARAAAAGEDSVAARIDTASATAALEPKPGSTALAREFEVRLGEAATVSMTLGAGTSAQWAFAIIPDTPPKITRTAEPEPQLSGAFKLAYTLADDYGVVGAEAKVLPAGDALGGARPGRSLVPAPDFSLALPQARGRIGAAQTMRDLTQHPWAGARVRMVLEATDEAGQTGRTEPFEFTLPVKPMSKPLARALVEQRRILALDADRAGQVQDAMDALMIAPERFIDNAGHYFGLRMIVSALKAARTDDELRGVMDLMWTVARQIEDGDLSDAEKALREAQENLRKAIEQGAPEQEIARLTEALRKAMDRYLAEMMERNRRDPQTARQADPNARLLRKQDLDKMLKRIEDLARTGSKDAAQQLLNELQRMMENMQAGRPQRSPQQQGDNKMSEMLDKLAELMQKQQDLLDRTYKLDPRGQQRPNGRRSQQGQQQPMTPDQLAEMLKQLEKGQGEAQQALKDLMEQMEQEGLGEGEGQQPGSKGKLGEAGEAMGRSGQALGRGRPGEAVGPEGQALDALRQGAQGLAREMMQRQGQGQGPGQGTGQANNDPGGLDPLGRPRSQDGPDFSDSVKIPGEIDAERARRILEDIRSRLSQQTRPQLELDYLDRLLKGD